MKKQLLIIALLSSVSVGISAKDWDGDPMFEGDVIKMRAALIRCGGVTIAAKSGVDVKVQSRLYSLSWFFGTKVRPQAILTKKKRWVQLPPGGLRARYGWPGKGGFFGVACRIQNERGVWVSTPCSQVVELDDVKHNSACIPGPLGPRAAYRPLNMKRK